MTVLIPRCRFDGQLAPATKPSVRRPGALPSQASVSSSDSSSCRASPVSTTTQDNRLPHLGLNDYRLDVDDDEAYDLVIGVAEGRRDVASIVVVLRAWGIDL